MLPELVGKVEQIVRKNARKGSWTHFLLYVIDSECNSLYLKISSDNV